MHTDGGDALDTDPAAACLKYIRQKHSRVSPMIWHLSPFMRPFTALRPDVTE